MWFLIYIAICPKLVNSGETDQKEQFKSHKSHLSDLSFLDSWYIFVCQTFPNNKNRLTNTWWYHPSTTCIVYPPWREMPSKASDFFGPGKSLFCSILGIWYSPTSGKWRSIFGNEHRWKSKLEEILIATHGTIPTKEVICIANWDQDLIMKRREPWWYNTQIRNLISAYDMKIRNLYLQHM